MTNKHTPGPWYFVEGKEDEFCTFISTKENDKRTGSQEDAVLWSSEWIDATTPDLRLMAAAPELLAALKRVIATIEKSDAWWIDSPDRGGFDADAIQAVIAKAEGARQ